MRERNLVTVIALIAALLFCVPARAADIGTNPPGPTFSLPTLAWGPSTATSLGFNNNFWFSPLSPNESVCVYVYNNNTTNPHPFNAAILVSANPQELTPSDGTWNSAATANLTAGVSPSVAAGFGASISGVALIAVSFSGSTALGGAPDTASVRIIQTQGTCTSSQNFNYSVPNNVAALIPFDANSQSLGQSYNGSGSQTNPVAGQLIAGVNSTASVVKVTGYMDSVTLSTSVADTLTVTWTSNTGTCTETNPLSTRASAGASGGVASQAFTFRVTCTVTPTASVTIVVISLPAGGAFTYDLKGFSIAPNNGNGIQVTSAAVTGTVSASFKWYEK